MSSHPTYMYIYIRMRNAFYKSLISEENKLRILREAVPTTIISFDTKDVENEGASADTSQLKLPLRAKVTFVRTTR